MSRVAGSYESVIRGVSQQVPQDRRPGQHYEQVNMISDPVRGLARRHGSVNVGELRIGAVPAGAALNGMLADTETHRVYSFQSGGKEYDLIYRTKPYSGPIGVADYWGWCYSKTDSTFIPVSLAANTTMTSALLLNGASAVTSVGKYVFIVPNGVNGAITGVDTWADTRWAMVAWVRAGAYSRTYKVRLQRADGTEFTGSYTTPTSSYPLLLDTSDIPAFLPDGTTPDPAYNKAVNDRVNAYNGEVTKYIGTAAAAITPQAIAQALYTNLLSSTSGTGITMSVIDSTVIINSTGMANPVVEITCEDGGDGSTLRGVGGEVTAADQVSTIHYPGKVVKVRPKKNDGSDVFYLKAYAKKPGSTGWGEVMWREAAGYEATPSNLWCMGLPSGGQFIIGGSASDLAAKAGGTHPTYTTSGAGDRTSNPAPSFIGRQISYIGLFQDRLLVVAGSSLSFSRSGDYQNFYRSSVLTLDADEPVEMFALGTEDDTIKAGATYDRNLLLFGKRKQYIVSGRQPLTPTNASVVVQSSHEDAVDSMPVNSGNFVFYNKYRSGIASMHQVQIGQLADTPESYDVSKQLDRYLVGRPWELVATTAPNMVFLRTTAQRDRFYAYTYLDSAAGSERLFDSWSTWQTPLPVGWLTGLSRHDGDVLGYYLRYGRSVSDSSVYIYVACDRFSLDTGLADTPYLDSQRPLATTLAAGSSALSPVAPGDLTQAAVAFNKTTPEFLLGTTYNLQTDLVSQYPTLTSYMVAGWSFPAFVTPTNPYILDRNGKAIVTGRLTLTKIVASIADSGGIIGKLDSRYGSSTPTEYLGRSVGSLSNLVGRAPVTTTSVSVMLGREVRDFTYTLSAVDWLPLTITAIEWTGQFFNNTRRG